MLKSTHMTETAIQSREEDAELQRSTKKVKENHNLALPHVDSSYSSPKGRLSYKEKLLGEIPGAFEHVFNFGLNMDTEAESDDELPNLPIGEKAVKFSGSTKTKIRVPWTHAIIVKVFGKTVGYQFLHSHILSLWKPEGWMDCIDLGSDFFLIKFHTKDDHDRVLRDGHWFVGGHYFSIRCWEPNFRPSSANLSSVAVWIRLPELSIKYYAPSALREIGEAIEPVLRIDAHTAVESRGRYTRFCVQVNFNEPIIKLLKMGGIDQPVQYEGIHSLCFACGHVGHKAESCPYKINTPVAGGDAKEAGKYHARMRQTSSVKAGDAFGPWVLVTRKRQSFWKELKDKGQLPPSGSDSQSPRSQLGSDPFRNAMGSGIVDGDNFVGKRKPMRNPVGGPSGVESADKPTSLTKPITVVSLLDTKAVGSGPKSSKLKKKSRDSGGRKESNKKIFPTWKEVGAISVTSIVVVDAKQRSMGSLGFSLSKVREVKEFRAGGSAALSVTRNGASAVGEAPTMELCGVRSNLREEAYMRTEGSGEDMEIIPNPDPELPSLRVSSNQVGLSSSEAASTRIASLMCCFFSLFIHVFL
ncbi:uncharacterized protein LOC142611079 [Castanea sativa]|uniref:uncharacterized protein LOC142611079 n=1 Tax=Castanea sativa TaxID=21020 RepID=UPI003F654221